jgi:hypothetical protein
MTHAPPAARPRLGLAFAAVVLLVASAVGFAATRAGRDARTPGSTSLSQAAAAIRAGFAEGDGVAFVPAWSAVQPWLFEDALAPHGVGLLDVWVPSAPLEAWTLHGVDRLWVVATHDAAHRAVAELGLQPALQEGLGEGTTLLRFDGTDALAGEVAYAFRAHLKDALVQRGDPNRPEKARRCRWQGDKHRCSGPWWKDVDVRLAEVGNTRRWCMFAQPDRAEGTLMMRWDEVPRAGRIEGRFGNVLWAVRNDAGSTVRLRVRVGGEAIAALDVAPGDFRWHRFEAAIPPRLQGQPISFELDGDDTTWRQTCFDARLLDPVAPLADAGE